MVKPNKLDLLMSLCVFDVIDVLDTFFELRPRSNTLRGNAPVRAVQACPPYVEGCGFGFELFYRGEGLALHPDQNGSLQVTMLDALADGFNYSSVVEPLFQREVLSNTSRWHAQLRDNWWWTVGDVVHVWTGLLVRPREGYWLRTTELFNAPHLQLSVAEDLFHDSQHFSPLVLQLRLQNTDRTLIRDAIASISPLAQVAPVTADVLAHHDEVGQRVIEYYDDAYFEAKLSHPPTRKYAKWLRQKHPAHQPVAVSVAVVAHRGALDRVQCESFCSGDDPSIAGPGYFRCLAPADMQLRFLGKTYDVAMGEQWAPVYEQTLQAWETIHERCGRQYVDNMTFAGECPVHLAAGPPALVATIDPLVSFRTPEGWSMLFEGSSQTIGHGLRGLIRSDCFHTGAFAFEFFQPPLQIAVQAAQAIGTAIPIPNELLDIEFTMETWAA